MKTRLGRASRPPARIKTRLGRPFHAKKVYPPIGLRIEICKQLLNREGNFRRPQLLLLIQVYPRLHSALRISFVPGWSVQIDIQIYPHSIWTDFEFPITMRIRRIRLQKNFRNVAIPELIAPAVGVAVRIGGEVAISALKAQVESFRGPKEPYFGAALRVCVLALPVRLESDRLGEFPCLRRRKSVFVERRRERERNCCSSSGQSPAHSAQ